MSTGLGAWLRSYSEEQSKSSRHPFVASDLPRGKLCTIRCLDHGFVTILDWMGDDSTICQAARVSYTKVKSPSDDRALIRYMMRHGHSSPFEHVVFRLHVKAPIFVLRQWMRHRAASYNEISARYSELQDEFYLPDVHDITSQNTANSQGGSGEQIPHPELHRAAMLAIMQNCFDLYSQSLSENMRRELARIVLPLATYSEMYVTVNLHNLLHFLSLRCDKHAQQEMRVYADAILSLIRNVVPLSVEAWEDYDHRRGAVKLSRLEVDALQQEEDGIAPQIASDNKRERREWKEKAEKLGYIVEEE